MKAWVWLSAVAAGLAAAAVAGHPHESGVATSRGVRVGWSAAQATLQVVLALALVAAVGAVAFALWRIRTRPSLPIPAMADDPLGPVVERWHCILEAVTPAGRVVVRRGDVPYPAVTSAEVRAEVVRRYVDRYGKPDGVELVCSAVPVQRIPERAAR